MFGPVTIRSRRARRHEAAAAGEQRDLRHLPHVRALAAHVRAGDEQQLARSRERRVVRDEVLDLALDHEVAALADLDAILGREFGPREVEQLGRSGERTQRV